MKILYIYIALSYLFFFSIKSIITFDNDFKKITAKVESIDTINEYESKVVYVHYSYILNNKRMEGRWSLAILNNWKVGDICFVYKNIKDGSVLFGGKWYLILHLLILEGMKLEFVGIIFILLIINKFIIYKFYSAFMGSFPKYLLFEFKKLFNIV